MLIYVLHACVSSFVHTEVTTWLDQTEPEPGLHCCSCDLTLPRRRGRSTQGPRQSFHGPLLPWSTSVLFCL